MHDHANAKTIASVHVTVIGSPLFSFLIDGQVRCLCQLMRTRPVHQGLRVPEVNNKTTPANSGMSEKIMEKTDVPKPGTPPCAMAVSRSSSFAIRSLVMPATALSVSPF